MYYSAYAGGWTGRKMPLSPRAMGRLTIGLGVLSACLCLALGNIAFRTVIDPEMVPQFFGSAQNASQYSGLTGICLLIATAAGLMLALYLVETWLPYKSWALLLVFGGGLLGLFTEIVPLVRGIAAVLPIIGLNLLLYSIGRSSYSGPPDTRPARLNLLFWAGVPVILLPSVVYEATWEGHKIFGALCLYALAVVPAVLSLALACVVREGIRTVPAVPSGMTVMGYHVPKEREAWRTFVPFLLLAVVLPILFVPPLELAWSGPVLDITHESGSAGSGSVNITLRVVNRGALAAGGPLVLEVSNASGVLATEDLGAMNGLEVRTVHITFPAVFRGSHYVDYNISLLYQGRKVETGAVHILVSPIYTDCAIMPLMVSVALAGAALPPLMGKRKRRAGH